jgi:hypothetical protein
VLELRHVLLGSGFFRKIPGQHELCLEHRAGLSYAAVQSGGHPIMDGVVDAPLDILDRISSASLKPAAVQVFGDAPQLDNEVIAEVLRLDLASFLLPKPCALLELSFDGAPRIWRLKRKLGSLLCGVPNWSTAKFR